MTWNADALVAAYFQALEELHSLHGQHLSETVACCFHCGGPSSQRVSRMRRGLREWHLTCTDCGKPWQPADLEVGLLRSSSSMPTDLTERKLHSRLDRLRPLKALIEPRPKHLTGPQWKHRLSLWRVYLVAGPVRATTLIQAHERDPSWTRDRLEELIATCRKIIEARLRWQRSPIASLRRTEVLQ